MRVGSDGFQIMLMSEKGVRGSGKGAAEIRRHGVDHILLPEKAVAAPGSEVGHGKPGNAAQTLDLAPEFCFRPGIQNVESELARFFHGVSCVELSKVVKRL